MAGKKKILYLFNVSWFFVSHRLPVARAAQKAGFEVHVAAAPDGHSENQIISEGFSYHRIPFHRSSISFFREVQTLFSILRLYYNLRPDIVEQATIKPVIYGGIVARLLSAPSVVNWMTGLGYVFIGEGRKKSFLRHLALLAYKFCFQQQRIKVIFENPDDRSALIDAGLLAKEYTVLIRGAGVDVDMFSFFPEPEGMPLVVLVSRMLRDKGVAEFVEAARLLKRAGMKARFVLVGDCDLDNPASFALETLRNWHESKDVEWWGHRKDIPSVFAQAHIVCLPSYREGLPKVLIEAAACGRPIVATDVPGCREVVRNGENGLLVPVRNAPALAEALKTLVDDPAMRRRMGGRGREIAVEEFRLENIVAATLAVYNS